MRLPIAALLQRGWGLALVVVIAAALRLTGLSWDDGTYPHPDERFLSTVSGAVHTGALTPTDQTPEARAAHAAACHARNAGTAGVGGWFDTQCSDFNPANVGHAGYAYGQFPLAAVRVLAEAAAFVTGAKELTQYGGIHLVGRAYSALADLCTLFVLFLLGRLLWGIRVGVLAAAFYAFAVLPIQSSHFWTVDTTVTLFTTLSLLFLVRFVRFGQRADALAFGAAWGLAMASKISVAPLILLLPLAAYRAPMPVVFVTRPDWLTRLGVQLPALLLAGLGACVAFRIASPYAFAGPSWHDLGLAQSFLDQVNRSRELASGSVDIPPNWQWLARTPWLAPGGNLVLWGLGAPLAIAAIASLVCLGWRLLRGTPIQHARALAWLWAIGYFAWMGQQWVASMRYFLPIYPVLCLFAAAWLVPWWRARRLAAAPAGARKPRTWLPAAVAIIVLGSTAAWALAFHTIYTTLHPYVAASHWVLRNVPAPVSAPIAAAGGPAGLINWPAAGEFGAGVPPRVAAATRAPASGSIDRLRLHRYTVLRGDATPSVRARVLDATGVEVASTGSLDLAAAMTGATRTGLELPLRAPLALIGGRTYQLQIEVSSGVVALEGSRIAHEGAWNDAVPTRVPWPAPAAVLDLRGPSGTASRGAELLDAVAAGYYAPVDLRMVEEDDERKRQRLIEELDAAEWLIVPNNRFYDSMRRNPLRFPLSTRFYDALFAGELGYARHLVVGSMPRLGGWSIDDQALPAPGRGIGEGRPWAGWAAEEAFSVYDHPSVFIFRKAPGYSRAALGRALTGIELSDIASALRDTKPAAAGRIAWSTLAASAAPDGLLLAHGGAPGTTGTPERPQPAAAEEASMLAAIAAWYALSLVIGWAAWPWLATLWPGLPDRGYGISRIAGLATLALAAWWLTWLGVSAWSGGGLYALLAVLGIAAAWRARLQRRSGPSQPLPTLRYIAVIEGLFLALFATGLLLRALNPDLWAPALGGEKPMDYALFNSVLATTEFPPPDPWFSDGRINYYYFGWVMTGVLVKMTGIAPGVAWNLALPTWFAMTGVSAFALAWNAVSDSAANAAADRRPWIAGSVALIATVLMGNLDLPRAVAPNLTAAQELIAADGPVAGAALREALTRNSERWYWAPSRTVGERPDSSHEINEFPAFSFVHGDLHPHLLALPLQLLALTALLALVAPVSRPDGDRPDGRAALAGHVVALACAVALLRVTNTWDWPLYLALACAGTALAAWRRVAHPAASGRAVAPGAIRSAQAGAWVAALLAMQALVALPFNAYFVTGQVSLRLFAGTPTALSAWLAMHGWFLLAILGWAWVLSRQPPASSPRRGSWQCRAVRALRALRWLGVAYTLLAGALVLYRGAGEVPAIGLEVAVTAWLAELLWRNAGRRTEAIGLALAATGFALGVVVEFVVIGQDMGRMNTFFKFHLQSWILLAAASGIALACLCETGGGARRWRLYRLALGALSALGLAYLPLAAYGRMHSRFDPQAPATLDGEAFLAYAIHDVGGKRVRLADDARLIRWLREHAATDAVIVEAQRPEYRWGSRMSSFTGRPTLLGYRHHQSQQRPVPALGEAIELRRQNVAAIYESADAARTLAVLRHYRAQYVIVGGLERAVYPAAGLAKFAALAGSGGLEVAFAAGDDVIYRVVAVSATATAATAGTAATATAARW